MGGFLVSPTFVKQPMGERDVMVASIFLGLTICFAIFSAATATRQTIQSIRRSRRPGVYILMIWGHWLANNCFGIVSFLYLGDVIKASFWLWFVILVLWVFQSQLIVQIIVNRISLLILVKSHARHIKYTVLAIMTAINISVFIIWIPTRLDISHEWVHIVCGLPNEIWDRIEKCIFLVVDAGLNAYFIYLVRNRLIANGLTKYVPLFRFNIAMVAISVSADVVLIGMMSLPNNLLYLQSQSVVYAIKLHIEMNMADLIKKVVRASNINEGGLSSGIGRRSSSKSDSVAARGTCRTFGGGGGGHHHRHFGRNKRGPLSSHTSNNDDHSDPHNYNNFIADLSRGANAPYRGHNTTHVSHDSSEYLDLDLDLVERGDLGLAPLGGIQKTTVVTQVVDGQAPSISGSSHDSGVVAGQSSSSSSSSSTSEAASDCELTNFYHGPL
ncbi:hypothetical protein F4778DRAFT_797143 [Xylariomycetidae sp. FL2044]|nr:hypothetical protein F4778DRAFT_797143 [Xylariomycetidae sp. FL2044]